VREIGSNTRGVDNVVQSKLIDVGTRLEEKGERLYKGAMIR